ncbi:MAG: hypothetical protein NPIRA01_04370 [Nitrospirales bacterium]|nr:MAG: hypothetical protein NPIRA01_04370 [Nitrospirales bacterium]
MLQYSWLEQAELIELVADGDIPMGGCRAGQCDDAFFHSLALRDRGDSGKNSPEQDRSRSDTQCDGTANRTAEITWIHGHQASITY